MARLSAAEVVQLIASGEDSFAEFKAAGTSPRDVAKELCAFLNAGGGQVLLGVEDDGEVTGLGRWEEESVMNLARTLIDPPTIPTWQIIDIAGAQVGVISVEMGVEKPHAVGGGEGKRYFVRVGSTSREASREELIRLTQASGAVQPDLRPVLGAAETDLDSAALDQRFGELRSVDWANLTPADRRPVLVNAEILYPESHVPTLGGLLCFGQDPAEQVPHASIECAAYPGPSLEGGLVDQARVVGRVEDQVAGAVAFIERNLGVSSKLEGIERIDEPRPSTTILREVVANAVAHRDYSVAGPIQVRVFSDHLQIVSPGSLPNGVTPEGMRVGVSVRRNPFIVQHLVDKRIIDALGRGIVIVVEGALAAGLQEPHIETPPGFVAIELAWRSAVA